MYHQFAPKVYLRAQRQEITIGINRNHFYDFHKNARNFKSTDQYGFSLGWSFDNMDTKKFPYRVTLKFDRYSGDVRIFNGGLGGGLTLDADVSKNVIAFGLYPLNFSIRHFLDFNFGVEFNALILKDAKGEYYYYQGGSPPISSHKPLYDGAARASNRFGLGLNARVALLHSNSKGMVPGSSISGFFRHF